MRPLIAAGILLSLALPASAHAGTVTADASKIVYTGGPADNDIDAASGAGNTIVISDQGIIGQCNSQEAMTMPCPFAPLVQFTLPAPGATLDTTGLPATVSTTV